MGLTQEKRIRLGRYEVALATDTAHAQRLRKSVAYRCVFRPILERLKRRSGKAAGASSEGAFATRGTPDHAQTAEAEAIWGLVSSIGWYHSIDLGQGVTTPGFVDRRPYVNEYGLPQDLSGKRCLDVGTWDGFWAFEMERRGAAEVVAIDIESSGDHDVPRRLSVAGKHGSASSENLHAEASESSAPKRDPLRSKIDSYLNDAGVQAPGAGFAVAKEILGSKVERLILNVYHLTPERLGTFDIVFVSEVLLHLRDPQTALENIFSVTDDFAIVAEPFNPSLDGFTSPLSEYIGTTVMGIWWMHSPKSIYRMMETAGFGPIQEVSRLKLNNRQGEFHKVVFRGFVTTAGEGA